MTEPKVPLSEAYRIGERMSKPWQWATCVLSVMVLGLLYVVIGSSLEVVNDVNAEQISAQTLATVSKIVKE